jgi:hypothetical protein
LVEGISNHPFPIMDDAETQAHLQRFGAVIDRVK